MVSYPLDQSPLLSHHGKCFVGLVHSCSSPLTAFIQPSLPWGLCIKPRSSSKGFRSPEQQVSALSIGLPVAMVCSGVQPEERCPCHSTIRPFPNCFAPALLPGQSGWLDEGGHPLAGGSWKQAAGTCGKQLLLASSSFLQAWCGPCAPSCSARCQHAGIPAGLEGAGSCRLLKIFPPST